MKPEDFKNATRHADAFRYFRDEASVWLDLSRVSLVYQQQCWNWFLLGWLAKAKQRQDLDQR
jgi:hypothetical protein